jgi:hypothetical protein
MATKLIVPYLYNFPNGLDVYFILFSVPTATFSSPLTHDLFGFEFPDTNESGLPLWDVRDLLAQGVLKLVTIRTKPANKTIRTYRLPYLSYDGDDLSSIRYELNTSIGQPYRGNPIVSYSFTQGNRISLN